MASEPTADRVTAATKATLDQPVRAGDRIASLDFVRGVAVLGILFANIVAFGQPMMAYIWPPALVEGNTPVDDIMWLVQFVLVDAKFRGLFSLLFGAGLYLFMEKAWARGSTRWLQFRRLFILMLFGLVHFFLIWMGDILTIYAVWGMVALLMMKWRDSNQMGLGVTLLIAGALLMVAQMGGLLVMGKSDGEMAGVPADQVEMIRDMPATKMAMTPEDDALYSDGSYLDIVRNTVTEDWSFLAKQVGFVGPTETLAWILIGMAFYRRGLFSGGYDRDKLKRRGWCWLVVGTVLSLLIGLWPYMSGFDFYITMFAFSGLGRLGQIPQVFGLLFLLVAYAPQALESGLGKRFAAAGRVAFTNYLGTSILMMFVFHGWALGLYGELGRAGLVLVVFAAWALMLAWSPWWLARYRYGPLEWLWRYLTYGKAFPNRR